jgi:hypothetical protein
MSAEQASRTQTDMHVQEIVRSAEQELLDLLRQRAEIMRRIGTVKQTLTGLANMFGDSLLNDELLTLLDRKVTRQSGFTRACRTVLMDARAPLGVRQICDELRRRFPGLLERHKEPVASVTTVLSRLVTYDEVSSYLGGDGRRVWEWIADRGTAARPLPDDGDAAIARESAGPFWGAHIHNPA